MYLKNLSIILCSLVLSACADSNQLKVDQVQTSNLFYDKVFEQASEVAIESEQEIYKLDAEMRAFVSESLLRVVDPHERAKYLLVKLFNKSPESLRYRTGANLIAADTFRQNTANCLSLTILAYALANEAQLNIRFQEVEIPEYWVREGEYNMLTGHVNLKVSGQKSKSMELTWDTRELIIDFDPYSTKQHFSKKIISKKRVTAMFYNNKGAQEIVAGDLNTAYAYLKAAINTDPDFSAAWGNLGLLYRKVGLNQFAEQTYLMALQKDAKNYNTWTNLSILLASQGNQQQANKINLYLDTVRLDNPYYHALLGDEAYHRGDYKIALKHYKKAKKMNDKEDVFYFGLAKVHYRLGNYDASQFNLNKAKKYANFVEDREKYQNKLDLLSKL